MLRLYKKKNGLPPAEKKPQAVVLPLDSPNRSLDFLTELVEKIRPQKLRDAGEANLRFQAFLYQVTQDKTSIFSLRKALLSQFLKTNIVIALTENGIVSSRSLAHELASKVRHKFLPELQLPDNFLFVINKIFYKKNDHIWVSNIDNELWIQFFEAMGIQVNVSEPWLIDQLLQSMQLLSYRITNLGLDKELTHLHADFREAISPFLELNRLVNEYLRMSNNPINDYDRKLLLTHIGDALQNCNQRLQWIKDQRIVSGTSLNQTYMITRLQQQIDRLFIITDVLDTDHEFNTERFVEYFKMVVRNENKKNSIREFLSENTSYVAYQIAEHGGRTGEKFITTTRKEFWKMFRSALGGGFIISFIAIIKNLLTKMPIALFWEGFLYSANYSLGFILIQDTGSTLATKQPAYTANNVVSNFDVQRTGAVPDLRNLAITIARVSRTQLASFGGNLLVVFPLTYALAWSYFKITGLLIATGPQAKQLLINQQPFHSLAIMYACFTGVFLFLSGLIAGYVENYVIYGKMGDRLRNLSSFKNNLSEKRRYKIVHYLENNLGSLLGNISLGFFLGMAGFLGHIFGLPFDIRHITISAANATIGFFGLHHQVSAIEIFYTLFGICLIGFLNFAVSFGLAFIVAIKSRGIHLREYPEFVGILWKYIKRFPADFFRAPVTPRQAEELRL